MKEHWGNIIITKDLKELMKTDDGKERVFDSVLIIEVLDDTGTKFRILRNKLGMGWRRDFTLDESICLEIGQYCKDDLIKQGMPDDTAGPPLYGNPLPPPGWEG